MSRLRTSSVVHVGSPSLSPSFSTNSFHQTGEQPSSSKSSGTPVESFSTAEPLSANQQQGQGQEPDDEQRGWQMSQQPGPQLVLAGGAFVLPHPDKVAKGGEDWYFVAKNQRAMGIADGVGGWAEVGIDAGAYARLLMNNACEAADEQSAGGPAPTGTTQTLLVAQDILEAAYKKTNVMGSSTACVVVLNGNTLSGSNLGDSGFMVIRAGEMLMVTTQQQHSFNFPYQIGGAEAMGDHPQQAERYEVKVVAGDVIVVGTDGLWDNCFHEEILSVIKYCQDGSMTPDKTAQVLAHYARHRASDTKFASPFSYAAYQAGIRYMGGKLDDITVVISFVEPSQPAQVASKL